MSESKANEASSRSKAYRFLALIYLKPPTKELITKFLREHPFSIESGEMKALSKYLSQNKLMSPEIFEERLAAEHTRLFGGVSREYGTPPPYESVWRGEGRVMGTATMNVLKSYGEAGVELADYTTEPPDHIGLELGYLSYLCSKEADALRNNDVRGTAKYMHSAQEFLRGHIEKWVPEFCRQIAEKDRTGFYRAIALLTKELVLADAEAIGEQSTTWDQQSP